MTQLALSLPKLELLRTEVRGVMFEIHLPSGKLRYEGPQLEGHAPGESLLNLSGLQRNRASRGRRMGGSGTARHAAGGECAGRSRRGGSG